MSVLFRHERYSDWYLHRMLRGQHRQEGGMNPMENGNKLINPEEILVSLPHRIASSDPWGLSEAQLIIVTFRVKVTSPPIIHHMTCQ